MPDATDSFCERCGTRYLFSAPAPKGPSFKGARVLAKGLRNFVFTDGQSMGEAIALARHDDDHEDSSRMTAEFYRTFNFCMTCRQYACDKCWNEKQGACLTCSPESDIVPMAPEEHLIVRTPVTRFEADLPRAARHTADGIPQVLPTEVARPAWPSADLLAEPSVHPDSSDRARHPDASSADPMARAAIAGSTVSAEPHQPALADWTLWPVSEERETQTTDSPARPSTIVDTAAEPPEAAEAASEAATSTAAPDASIGLRPEMSDTGSSTAAANVALVRPTADAVELALTPQELMLVEAQLAQVAPNAASVAPNQIIALEPAVGAAAETAAPELKVEAAAVEPAAESQVEAAPVEPAAPWMPAHTLAEDAALPPTRPSIPRDTIPGEARRTAASWEPESPAQLPPAADRPEKPQHTPVFARLFGRGTAASDAHPDAQPGTGTDAQADDQASEPWPHATRWSERPIEPHDRLGDAPAPETAALPMSAQFVAGPEADFVAEPETDDTLAPAAAGLPDTAQEATDIRAAALAQTIPEPTAIDLQPHFDLEIKAVDRLAGAPHASRSDPNHWPPLGARWQPQSQSGDAWGVPEDVPQVPALIAAQQVTQPPTPSMWAQSSQEVLNHGAVRVCHKCALPVSTQARFCRRCGTEQA